jgi:hypothetical protein
MPLTRIVVSGILVFRGTKENPQGAHDVFHEPNKAGEGPTPHLNGDVDNAEDICVDVLGH